MERSELEELHYITPIANVGSILERGILCNASAARVEHRSVADESVQERRSDVRVPSGTKLHHYVNLYLNARNSMLYRRARGERRTDELCVLRVTTEVLNTPGTVIADCNAASDYVQFYSVDDGLAALSRVELFATYWENWRHRSRMSAEALVPSVVGPEYLTGAYVGSDLAKGRLERIASRRLPIVRNNRMFFLRDEEAQ